MIRRSPNASWPIRITYSRPEIMGTPDPVSRRLELHNTWLVSPQPLSQLSVADERKADGLKHYIDWAATQGFGVIDVNVPNCLTATEVRPLIYIPACSTLICTNIFLLKQTAEGSPEGTEGARISAANELAVYLWENYIEYCGSGKLLWSILIQTPAAMRLRMSSS